MVIIGVPAGGFMGSWFDSWIRSWVDGFIVSIEVTLRASVLLIGDAARVASISGDASGVAYDASASVAHN
jgi:hypothetical protein